MLKLHGVAVSNCYNIVKQSLLEKGIAFDEVFEPPSQTPEFLAKSPMGKIPCLETPNGFLAESSVIIEYLEDTHPSPRLYPESAFARAKTREIMRICELYLDTPARRHLAHVIFGAPLSQSAYDEVRGDVERGLAALKRLAGCEPWVAGQAFSYADIVLIHVMGLVRHLMQAVYQWDPLADQPELAALLERISAREHSQAVLEAQQQAMVAMMAKKS